MSNQCTQCKNCGYTGWSKPKGNFLITIVLAIFLLVPAIIYEIWRRTGLGACIKCGSTILVPAIGCDTRKVNFQLNWFFVVGIPVAIVASIFAFLYISEALMKRGSPENLEKKCQLDGMKYYQTNNQFPFVNDAQKTPTMDKVEIQCRGTTTGEFKP